MSLYTNYTANPAWVTHGDSKKTDRIIVESGESGDFKADTVTEITYFRDDDKAARAEGKPMAAPKEESHKKVEHADTKDHGHKKAKSKEAAVEGKAPAEPEVLMEAASKSDAE